jgi:hypothetical protein
VAREIDGAPEDIEHTAVDRQAALEAQPLVQPLRIGASEIPHLPDAQVVQILSDAGADARNALEIGGS